MSLVSEPLFGLFLNSPKIKSLKQMKPEAKNIWTDLRARSCYVVLKTKKKYKFKVKINDHRTNMHTK